MTLALTDPVVETTTAGQIVRRAFLALQAIDLNEQPSPNESMEGLGLLNAMIAAWAAKNLNVLDVTVTGTTLQDSICVTDIDVRHLARGMNVSGTGIATGTRIASIDPVQRMVNLDGTIIFSRITLTLPATASGSVSLACTFLPMEAKHEQGLIALLAMQLSTIMGLDGIPPMVAKNANTGISAITGQYRRDARSRFDLPHTDVVVPRPLNA